MIGETGGGCGNRAGVYGFAGSETPHSFIRLRHFPPEFAPFRALARLQCVVLNYIPLPHGGSRAAPLDVERHGEARSPLSICLASNRGGRFA